MFGGGSGHNKFKRENYYNNKPHDMQGQLDDVLPGWRRIPSDMWGPFGPRTDTLDIHQRLDFQDYIAQDTIEKPLVPPPPPPPEMQRTWANDGTEVSWRTDGTWRSDANDYDDEDDEDDDDEPFERFSQNFSGPAAPPIASQMASSSSMMSLSSIAVSPQSSSEQSSTFVATQRVLDDDNDAMPSSQKRLKK